MKQSLLILAPLFLLGILLVGCNGSSDIVNPPTTGSYAISGIFVQDINTSLSHPDYNYLAISMTKNSNAFSSGQLFFLTTPLSFDTTSRVSDSVYTFTTTPRSYRPANTYAINIVDSTYFADTINAVVVDSFRISSYNPDSTTYFTINHDGVNIEWTSSMNIDGYVVAAVPADSAYMGKGYSAYVTSQTTSAFIPRDAFPAPVSDTLIYNLYVFAYTGVPDSVYSSRLLPVPFPSQLPDNIAHTSLTGHFGSVVVCRRVPLMVTPG